MKEKRREKMKGKMKEKMKRDRGEFFSENVSGPSNPPDELAQKCFEKKKNTVGRIIPPFFFESSDRVFNYLHDSNSIVRVGRIISEWVRARTVHHDLDSFRGCTFRGTVFGARNAPPERRECLARTGSPTSGTGARLKSNHSAMNRARVWTNSFTMAEHIQQESIAREGPLYSEELFHLLRTVIQGESLSHAIQFAQRLREQLLKSSWHHWEIAWPLHTENRTWLKNLIAQTRLRKLKWMRKSQRQLLRAHNLGPSQQLENSVVLCEMAAADGVLSNG